MSEPEARTVKIQRISVIPAAAEGFREGQVVLIGEGRFWVSRQNSDGSFELVPEPENGPPDIEVYPGKRRRDPMSRKAWLFVILLLLSIYMMVR